ncbi:MAG TPA: DinB family protein, partial [Anseongella sp.]
QPHGKYASVEAALAQLEATRDTILNYIDQANVNDLRNHIIESPGGTSDGYQSLLFIAGHTARHTLQINEVKSDPGFPENE